MHFLTKFLLGLALVVFSVSPVFGHGEGASFEKEQGDHLIDIGYEPDEFSAIEASTFSFSLLDKKTREKEDFDSIWVRIEKGKETVFATGVDSGINGIPTMIFVFPIEGDYTLYVRYEKDGKSIVETSFPLKVLSSDDNKNEFPLIPVVGGVALGFIIGFSLPFLFRKKPSE